MILDWVQIARDILTDVIPAMGKFLIDLLGALIALGIGWLVAAGIGKLVAEILKRIDFNKILERGGWKKALDRAELKIDPAGFVGELVKWILMIIVLLIAVDILGFTQFAIFLARVVYWLPNVVVAVAIFVVAVIIADYLAKLMRAWVEGMEVGYGHVVESIVRWSVWLFAILAILIQLGIARELVITLFTGIVALVVIAGGLAFGLGGKDIAAEILRDLQRRLKR